MSGLDELGDDHAASGPGERGGNMRSILFVMRKICVALLLMAAALPAQAERRLALVIGNAFYRAASPIPGAAADARAMAQALRDVGFEVMLRQDLGARALADELRAFRSRLGPDSVAVFYFSGHGLADQGSGLLIPVDAGTESEESMARASLDLEDVLQALEQARPRAALVFVDAAFGNAFRREAGMVRVDARPNTLVALASAGEEYSSTPDGRGEFTAALVRRMTEHRPVEHVLRQVLKDVQVATGGRQRPRISDGLRNEFAFSPAAAMTSSSAALAPAGQSQTIQAVVAVPPVAQVPASSPRTLGEQDRSRLASARCTACHDVAQRGVGPSWLEIAERHAANRYGIWHLADVVRAGSRGNWGRIAKPPSDVTVEEAEALVRIVLSLAPPGSLALASPISRPAAAPQPVVTAPPPVPVSPTTAAASDQQSSSSGGGFFDALRQGIGAAGMIGGVLMRDPSLIQRGDALMRNDMQRSMQLEAERQRAPQTPPQAPQAGSNAAQCAELARMMAQATREANDMSSAGRAMGAPGARGGTGPNTQVGAQRSSYAAAKGAWDAAGCR